MPVPFVTGGGGGGGGGRFLSQNEDLGTEGGREGRKGGRCCGGVLLPVRNQLLAHGESSILGHLLSLSQVLLAQVRQWAHVVLAHNLGGGIQHVAVLPWVDSIVAQDVVPLSDTVEGCDRSRRGG